MAADGHTGAAAGIERVKAELAKLEAAAPKPAAPSPATPEQLDQVVAPAEAEHDQLMRDLDALLHAGDYSGAAELLKRVALARAAR